LVTLNYPSDTADPRKPLKTAIETGKFAGQDVNSSFVSPTGRKYKSYTSVKSSSKIKNAKFKVQKSFAIPIRCTVNGLLNLVPGFK